jgi:hypothetical protein
MNDLTLTEPPPNAKIFHHSGEVPLIEDIIVGEDVDMMMLYSTDCPFKSERTFKVKVSFLDMDKLFHQPWIREVSRSKKTSIHSISSSARTVGQNLWGAYIIAINDDAIFSKVNALDAFATIRKSKDKTFKLMVGYLDKISAQEGQCEQDELLLYPKQYALLPDPEMELIDDEDILASSTGPVATPPSHERITSVPTPGVRQSIHLQTLEKDTANLTVKGIVIKAHHLTDEDPFDKLLSG